jgi:hypothetical protein
MFYGLYTLYTMTMRLEVLEFNVSNVVKTKNV